MVELNMLLNWAPQTPPPQMSNDDKTPKTQDELKAAISEKKAAWMAKPNGTEGLLERSQLYDVRKVKDCLVNMLAYASDLEQGMN